MEEKKTENEVIGNLGKRTSDQRESADFLDPVQGEHNGKRLRQSQEDLISEISDEQMEEEKAYRPNPNLAQSIPQKDDNPDHLQNPESDLLNKLRVFNKPSNDEMMQDDDD